MKNESWLRHVILTACLVLFPALVTSCGLGEQEMLKHELDTAVADIPVLAQFDHIRTFTNQWSHTIDAGTCFYARTWIVLGTQLPAQEALDIYTQSFASSGWELRPLQYDTTKHMTKGDRASAVLTVDPPGFFLEQEIDYEHITKRYETILVISVTFVLPQRDGC